MQQCIQPSSTNFSKAFSIVLYDLCFNILLQSRLISIKLTGDNSIEATPVPISNTEVKLYSADGTTRETSVGE